MPSRRQAQLATQIQRTAAQALAGAVFSSLITVTRSSISPDARHATVYLAGWNELSDGERAYVRTVVIEAITRMSTSKYTPRIELVHDDAPDHATRIQSLLSDDVDSKTN